MWDRGTLARQLHAAYGTRLPGPWIESIVEQTCRQDQQQQAAPAAPLLRPEFNSVDGVDGAQSYGRSVQCSQFHGPGLVLLGDAAHAMTNELRQGLNCAVESVRLMNVVSESRELQK